MLRSLKTNLLSLFCLLLLSSFAFAQNVNCDPQNRPNPADCNNQLKESTCGYYTENCPLRVCGINVMNPCEACSLTSPPVLYYQNTECNSSVLVESCFEGICNPATDPRPNIPYIPACGLKLDASDDGDDVSDSDQETFKNACEVCQSRNFPFYQLGPCSEDRVYCDDSDASDAADFTDDSDEDTVCAYFNTTDVGSASTTVTNGREACSDEAVQFWTEGACGPFLGNVTYCLPNNRPDDCSDDDGDDDEDQVCGFSKDGNGNTVHKVFMNACSACAEPGVLYHIPGSCTLEDGTFCDNYRTTPANPQISGSVCGFSLIGCLQSSCQQTYGNQYAACENGDVISFTNGPC